MGRVLKVLAGDTPAWGQLLQERGQRQQQQAAVQSCYINRAVLGGKWLKAPYFPIFRWLVGVSAVNGEAPGEAVKRQQIALFKHIGY